MSSQPLLTVQDYITDVRTMLLDTLAPYRYTDKELIVGLNVALLEGRRIRPDLFVYRNESVVPYFAEVSGEEVPMEPQFRLAFVYGTAAHALARDDEDIQDTRANAFRATFHSLLVGSRPPPLQGGTPGPGTKQPQQAQ